MIQRIQTIYFFLAAITLVVYAFFCDFNLLNIAASITDSFIPAIASVLVAFFSLTVILLFNKRNFQSLASSILILFVVATMVYFIYNFGIKLFYLEWTFYLFPLALILLFLGRKSVVADEKLIRSVDRLR
jgi:hypothetical protein